MRVLHAEASEEELSSAAELDSLVSRLYAAAATPVALTIDLPASTLTVGLAHQGCFVQVASKSGQPPYLVTVGNPVAPGTLVFYLYGTHHTEIPRRHLIPWSAARQVLLEFASHGRCSDGVVWEEI
jgi:hypothetical protein